MAGLNGPPSTCWHQTGLRTAAPDQLPLLRLPGSSPVLTMAHHWLDQLLQGSTDQNFLPLLRRLRASILAFYAITFAIAILVVAWLSYSDYHTTLRTTERQALSLARSLDEHVTRSFVSVEQAMQNVAEDLERDGGLERLDEFWVHQRLIAKVGLAPQIRGIIAIDAKGMLWAHGLEFPTRKIDLSDRGYFDYHSHQTDLNLRIGEPVISRTDYKWLIPLTRRLNRPDGSFGGVMLSGVDPAYYLSFYDSLKLDNGTSVQVMRNDGLLLINYPLDIARLGQNLITASGQAPITENGIQTRFFRERDPLHGDHFVAQLSSQSSVPLIVRVCFDADRVLARYKTDTQLRIATATLALTVLSMMLYLLLHQISRVEVSESRLRLTQFAVDESPEMIAWCGKGGHIRYANRRMATVSGYSIPELMTMNLGDIIGNDQGWNQFERQLHGSHSTDSVESGLRARGGRTIPVELTAAQIADEKETYLCITARDISERKAVQEELRQHRDHLQDMIAERTAEVRAMLDANPLAIALVVQRRIQLVNPAFESLFGHDGQSVRRLADSELHASPESFERLYASLRSELILGRTFRGETELRRRDGTLFWAVLFARALVAHEPERGIVIIIEDVSAQRAAALNLRQSEQLKRSVLDAMTDSFALIDTQRRFVDVNQALCQQLGLHRSALIGQRPETVWGETLGHRMFPAFDEPNQNLTQQEIMLPVHNGQRHPFQVSYGVIPDDNGKVAYRFAFFADISRQKQIASSLLDAKEAAEAASQAKSSFLTNMSHELRTPMHAILSFSEMGLLKSTDGDLNRYFERIQNAGKRLLTLLNDLLDLSRLEADRMSYDKSLNSLQHTVQAAVSEVSSLTIARHLQIHIDTAAPRIVAHFDRARITQVLINLLSNAIKFSPEGGTIHIDFLSEARLPDDQPAVGLSVRDRGRGIPLDELEIIFDAFEQGSHTHVGGSGLGLAISQRIMHDHGGVIYAANNAQGGAKFTILIPAPPQGE